MYEFSADTFHARRQELMERIGPDSVAVLVANPERTRSNDTDYPYRPASDILYMSGFREPQAVIVLAPGHDEGEFVMFVRERNPEKEQWEGRRQGPEGVIANYGADAAYTVNELDEELPQYLEERDALYYTLGRNAEFDKRVTRWVGKLRHRRNKPSGAPGAIIDVRDVLHDMRLRKSPEEVELMRRAAKLSSEAHTLAMKHCRPGMHEYELQALIEYHFRRNGAEFPAYSSIVGAGANATILHYTENRDVIGEQDVVLIDAGAELGFYAGDITRSFPASGEFTPAQRDLYQAVLDAQLAVLDQIEPGVPYNTLQETAIAHLTQSMVDLGLLDGAVDELIEEKSYKKYYPHNIGHWLGIDVHDVGPYHDTEGSWRPLEPNMVLTVEPGIYVPEDDEDAPAELRGVGVRIEDDILVCEGGYENLTADCPKAVDEIEALIGIESDA